MEIDKTTYNDLSLFQHDEEFSIFHKINFTRTVEGREWLSRFFSNPFSEEKRINDTQYILGMILELIDQWPTAISNGTLMVISKFFNSSIDDIPDPNLLNAASYKLFHTPDFSLIRYSIVHFADFLKGMDQLLNLLDRQENPMMIQMFLARARELMNVPLVHSINARDGSKRFSWLEIIRYGKFFREQYKNQSFELISIYGRLDAWFSMAMASKQYSLSFPAFSAQKEPVIEATGLYHILLPGPVPYDVKMSRETNFIFLTGANMAGKSTFIRAVGSAVFLAHLGMGVPASSMTLSIFDGLLSNINVVDNIAKGESYFFNEVQRIRNTIQKINDGRKWLVLIDELFKGTNVQDAMKCSSTVIRGLIKMRNSLFILSTHLYEIGEELKTFSNISFKYFETSVNDDQLVFNYQLKDGISNDRLGYIILKREKVVELLEKL